MSNKNKTTKQVILLVATLFLLTFVSAESCYVQFNLEERLVPLNEENFTTSFSYTDLENLYGNYDGFVRDNSVFGDSTYALKVYDASNREIGAYSFDTSLLMFYDNFENETNPGGIEVLNESVNSVMIPFNESISSAKVFMNDELKLEFVVSNLSCVRNCKIPDENGTIGERCCDDYLESWMSNDNFTCISCGDGVCSKFEDEYLCWSDCKPELDEMNCSDGYVASDYGCVEGNICGNNILESGEECDDGDIFDGDGCSSNCKLEKCKDYDFSNVNWEMSLLNSSYVFFDFNRSYDSCKDSNTLIENYCGINIFRWDVWNINEKIAKQKEIDCEFGCFNGACVENPEECVIDDDCLVDEICVEGICINENDLPEEPSMPRGNI
jgi:cysteine-rich repeat protein